MARLFGKNKQMGWRKDKYDHRDYLHKARLAAIPTEFSLLDIVPPVRDQGNVGSCTGFGFGAQLTGLATQRNLGTEWFSPTWIYNGARFIEGSLREDTGAYPRDCCDWLVQKGGLLEHFWPYDPNKLDTTSPPSKFDQYAAAWPVVSYFRITGGVSAICDALASGKLVSIGTPWYAKWMDPPMSGILPSIGMFSSVVGGHEWLCYGYSDVNERFLAMNSWGDSWGKRGHFEIPYSAFSYFGLRGGYDAHYLTVDWEEPEVTLAPVTTEAPGPLPTPEPQPEPEKKRIQLREMTDTGWKVLFDSEI